MSISTHDNIIFDSVGHIPFMTTDYEVKDWRLSKDMSGLDSLIYDSNNLLNYDSIEYGELFDTSFEFQHDDGIGYYEKARKVTLICTFDDIKYKAIIKQYILSYTIDNGDNETDKHYYDFNSDGLNYMFLKLYSYELDLIETNNCFLIDCYPTKYMKKES